MTLPHSAVPRSHILAGRTRATGPDSYAALPVNISFCEAGVRLALCVSEPLADDAGGVRPVSSASTASGGPRPPVWGGGVGWGLGQGQGGAAGGRWRGRGAVSCPGAWVYLT